MIFFSLLHILKDNHCDSPSLVFTTEKKRFNGEKHKLYVRIIRIYTYTLNVKYMLLLGEIWTCNWMLWWWVCIVFSFKAYLGFELDVHSWSQDARGLFLVMCNWVWVSFKDLFSVFILVQPLCTRLSSCLLFCFSQSLCVFLPLSLWTNCVNNLIWAAAQKQQKIEAKCFIATILSFVITGPGFQ